MAVSRNKRKAILDSSIAPKHPVWIADPNRYMFFATRNRWMNGFNMVAATNLNYIGSKLFFGSAPYETNSHRWHFSGFAVTEGGGAPQETIYPTTDITIDEAFVIVNGVEYAVSFGGSASTTVTAQTGSVWGTTPTLTSIPRDAVFGFRTNWHVAVGQSYIGGYRIQKHRGEKLWAAADLASLQALATADAAITTEMDTFYNTVGNASNSQPLAYGPDIMVAKGWDGRPVPLILSDSLKERQEIAASADDRGSMGVWGRWLDVGDPVHGRIPHFAMGCPGAKSAQELTGSGATIATKRWAILDEVQSLNSGKNCFTIAIDQSGRNDNSATASTWYNAKFGLVDRFKTRYPGVSVVGCTILPTTTSTNTWRDLAGQSVSTLWSTTLATVNDTVRASSKYSAIFDIIKYWASPNDPNRFPGHLEFPLGNLVGHPGLQDGTTTWNTAVSPVAIPVGYRIAIEYQPGLTTGRTVLSCVNNGTTGYDITVLEVLATNVQDNAPIYGQTSADGVHSQPYHIVDTVRRFPQSEKLKLYPVV
jgi:hypothetical protein